MAPEFFAKIYIDTTWSLTANYNGNLQFPNDRLQGMYVNLLNATLAKSFMQDKFSLYFTVRDLLNDNRNLNRSFYGNTYAESENQRLRRYFLFGVRWDFKNKGPKPDAETPSINLSN